MLGGEPSADQQQMNNEFMGEDTTGGSGGTEPDFPHAKLALLDDKISSPRWVVPVLPEQELEVLLQASIDLCRKGEMQVYCILAHECLVCLWRQLTYRLLPSLSYRASHISSTSFRLFMHHVVVLGFVMVYIAGYRIHKVVVRQWKTYGDQSCG